MMEIRQLGKVALLYVLSPVAVASAADQIPAPSPCFKQYASTILSSFMALTEQHIRTAEHELAVLSMTGEVNSADWEKMLSTTEGEVSYEFENRPRYVIYQTSALMGWKFAVGIKPGSGASVGSQ